MCEVINDEIDVLKSIYQEKITHDHQEDGTFRIMYSDNVIGYFVLFDIPPAYPDCSVSYFDIKFDDKSINKTKITIIKEITDMIEGSAGDVILFNAIERIRELTESSEEIQLSLQKAQNNEAEDVENENDTQPSSDELSILLTDSNIKVIHGPITTETKSSFQSHFAEVHSMEDVRIFRQIVLSDKKVARATHNIFAYRFTCPKTGILYHDNDDDGESAAGSRVAEMIRLMDVDGAAVIITRWFGGVLLGPDRFKFINNSARNLLEEHGFGKRVKKR